MSWEMKTIDLILR